MQKTKQINVFPLDQICNHFAQLIYVSINFPFLSMCKKLLLSATPNKILDPFLLNLFCFFFHSFTIAVLFFSLLFSVCNRLLLLPKNVFLFFLLITLAFCIHIHLSASPPFFLPFMSQGTTVNQPVVSKSKICFCFFFCPQSHPSISTFTHLYPPSSTSV